MGSTAAAAPGAGLELRAVGVRFGGVTALADVGLSAAPGQVVGVIGPNGAGKTTLFNVVSGFVRPWTGSLLLDGRPLRPRPHRLAELGVARTLQGLGLFSGLSVLENVMAGAGHLGHRGFVAGLLGLPRADHAEDRLRARALAVLEHLGVADVAAAVPPALPYPVRKRVALARALVASPRLLLLDEPAGGLGAQDVADLARTIADVAAGAGPAAGLDAGAGPAAGCAVLLVEHDVDLVMAVCHRVVVLDFGRVIATGTPAQVRADPAVAAAYLGTPADGAHGAAEAPAAAPGSGAAAPGAAPGPDLRGAPRPLPAGRLVLE